MKDIFDLSGKCAVVTGGGGLLGHQHARALLTKNCTVELWDNNQFNLEHILAKLKEEFSSEKILGKMVDITNEQEVQKCTSDSILKNGKIDILINNAAINPKFNEKGFFRNERFEEYNIKFWSTELNVGLTGTLICSKIIGREMAKQKKGCIVNISSDLSVISPDQRIYLNSNIDQEDQFVKPISYSAIKTGLLGITRYLATYWATSNIRVNALSPGGVYDGQSEEFVEAVTERIPLGRLANIDEYIGAIQFLCSDASSYMTGQNLVIDGGRTIW